MEWWEETSRLEKTQWMKITGRKEGRGKKKPLLPKQNLLLSLIYNLVTIPLAMAGFVIPLVAALSMSLSSLLVVANSMRIKLKN